MFGQFFNIDESAFSIAPNPKYLFLSKQHEEALAHLLYGVSRKGGFVCLTGDIGTGKTTICRCMFEQLPENTDLAFVVNPKFSPLELLGSICDELQLDYSSVNSTIKEYVEKINAYLIDAHAKGRNTVLVIDEAQNLSIDALEHVRALTNLETNEQKLLQIILIGQPELKTLLAKPELEQVNQRITARFHIGPLSLEDTNRYIQHRLLIAGAKQKIFSASNIKQIYRYTKGIPRLINILCDRILLGAYTLGTSNISKEIIQQSADEVFDTTSSHNGIVPKAVAASVFALLISGAVVFAYQNGKYNRDINKEVAVDSLLNSVTEIKQYAKVEQKPKKIELLSKKAKSLDIKTVDSSSPVKSSVSNESIANINEELNKKEISEKPASYSTDINSNLVSKQSKTKNQLFEKNNKSEFKFSNYGKAYKQLFRLWGVHYTSTDRSPCEHAVHNQLQCYQDVGTLDKVIRLNRPVLLKSKDEQFGPNYIVLVSIEDKHAIVDENGEYKLVSFAELEENWSGHFEILWRPMQAGVRFIKPGYTGEAVEVLDKKLSKLQGYKSTTKNPFEYSGELVDRVRAFQLANNLPSDGVVGPVTQIYFNNKRSDTPYLIK